MRLTKEEAAKATAEILSMLKEHPEGLPTRDLIGTPRFHGMRTLTSRQIHRLLKQQPTIIRSFEGSGNWAASWWQMKPKKV